MREKTTGHRPDPRLAASWCREGVAHDHGACGPLWNNSDPVDVERAARWADDRGIERQAAMRRAAELLRNPYLCNWDSRVAATLADLLEHHAGGGAGDEKVVALTSALLSTFGVGEEAGA